MSSCLLACLPVIVIWVVAVAYGRRCFVCKVSCSFCLLVVAWIENLVGAEFDMGTKFRYFRHRY